MKNLNKKQILGIFEIHSTIIQLKNSFEEKLLEKRKKYILNKVSKNFSMFFVKVFEIFKFFEYQNYAKKLQNYFYLSKIKFSQLKFSFSKLLQ